MYRTAFLDFKYEPLSFLYVEIRTSSRTLTTPTIVQPVVVVKPVNPLRGGTCLEIISLRVQTFTIHV